MGLFSTIGDAIVNAEKSTLNFITKESHDFEDWSSKFDKRSHGFSNFIPFYGLAKAEANRISKKQKALAEVEAREREAKDKKIRELAQVEANRARIQKKAIADAKANEAKKERERLKNEKENGQAAVARLSCSIY